MSFFKTLFSKRNVQDDTTFAHPPDLDSLIQHLIKDKDDHSEIGPTLNAEEIKSFEEKSGFHTPPSFSKFLQEYGDGAQWLYGIQPMDTTSRPAWLKDIRPKAPEIIQSDFENQYSIEHLFCLMSEDSNGGSWCWLTSERDSKVEIPLAYYWPSESKLYYQVASFTNWLQILVSTKREVIRSLDVEFKLGLG